MKGRYCRLEPLDSEAHSAGLWQAYGEDPTGAGWTYLSDGPYDSFEDFKNALNLNCRRDDMIFFAIVTDSPVGIASYLRMFPREGSIEVGNIHYAPRLRQTPAATEAMYLMMKQIFELGYRRYEWKCNALNAPSRRAALRYGFTFEGIFRQALVVKGRNRDTAWFSLLDGEWPKVRSGLEAWLEPANFDEDGGQRKSLSELISE